MQQREQELTDLIVENTERRHLIERMNKDHKSEVERLRGEACQLMEENHRYARDLDRIARENAELQGEIEDIAQRAEQSRVELEREIEEKTRMVERMSGELSERQGECSRL